MNQPRNTIKLAVLVGIGLFISAVMFNWLFSFSPDTGKLGGPIEGLTSVQLKKFYAAKALFAHEFKPEEGLGPFYNGQSCYQCHGAPGSPGGQGSNIETTSLVRFGSLQADVSDKAAIRDRDVTHLQNQGGPQLYRKSINNEIKTWPIPEKANLVSRLTAPPLFGIGLLNAITDATIEQVEELQIEHNPYMRGHVEDQIDSLTRKFKCGRFGWKNQQPNLLLMTAEMMHRGLGITSFVDPQTTFESSRTPDKLRQVLPPEPNDAGNVMAKLTYFQMLLAPPPQVPATEKSRRGEIIFDKLQCSFCHIPELTTASKVLVVDPDSQFPRFSHMEITALENKPVRAYTDLLLHNMGNELADGLPEKHTTGGDWRTAPLWGLRFRKYFLHDGRAQTVTEAISYHDGQAAVAKKSYLALPPSEKEDLLAFLNSL